MGLLILLLILYHPIIRPPPLLCGDVVAYDVVLDDSKALWLVRVVELADVQCYEAKNGSHSKQLLGGLVGDVRTSAESAGYAPRNELVDLGALYSVVHL